MDWSRNSTENTKFFYEIFAVKIKSLEFKSLEKKII